MALTEYDPKRCRGCGTCLLACPGAEFTEQEAVQTLRRLAAGDGRVPGLLRCHSCFTCSQACPEKMDVHGLVMKAWGRSRSLGSIPGRARLGLPHQSPPNAWTMMKRFLAAEERALLEKIAAPVKDKPALFLGCNQLLDPYIALTPLFDGLTVAAAPGVCCGEPYYRMGVLDGFEASARAWLEHWSEKDPAEMIVMCPACLNMFTNIYPAALGLRVPFPVRGLHDWLLEKVRRGGLRLNPKSRTTALVQDSCHGRVLGQKFFEDTRELLAMAGVNDLGGGGFTDCCGFAGAARRFNPVDMYMLAARRFRAAGRLRTKRIVGYCNGCVLMLSMAERLYPSRFEVRHLIELVSRAAGFNLSMPHRARAARIIAASAALLVTKAAAGGNKLELGSADDAKPR